MSCKLPAGVLTAVALIALMLPGCTGSHRVLPADSNPLPHPDWHADGLPAFPGDADPGISSAVHSPSEAESVIPGIDELDQSGDNNYEDPGLEALIIAPSDEDDLAWAEYNLSGLGDDRPIQINIEVESAPLLPGGDDPLPLSFWVGLSNYTENSWEWYGPFDESQTMILNSPQVLERYIGSTGNFYYCLATLSGDEWVTPGNPDGLTACQINLGVVTTEDASSGNYNETKPLFVPIESHSPSSLPPKGGSDLDPAQYVTLNWTHVPDMRSPNSGAARYQVFRQGPGDGLPYIVGSVAAPASQYIDPTDNLPGVPELVPGWTYTYSLRALNEQGHTALDSIVVTVPVLNNFWAHTWGQDNEDKANGILVDNDGEIYLTGYTSNIAVGTRDLLLVGYSADGNLKQAVAWGDAAEQDEGWGICGDQNGNKYVTGFTRSVIGEQQLALLKFNANDGLEWDRNWNVGAVNGVNSSTGWAVDCNPAGTLICVVGAIAEAQDSIIMMKFDAGGNLITTPQSWDGRWYDFTGRNTYGLDVALAGGGVAYVCGEYITGLGNTDALVMLVNPDQSLGWAKTWGTPFNDEGRAIAVDQVDGSCCVAGYYNGDQVMVVKFSSNGTVLWQKGWEVAAGSGQANAIALVGENVVVTGDVGIAGEFSAFVLLLNKNDGSLVSQRVWGGTAMVEAGWGVAGSAGGGGLYIAGVGVNAGGSWEIPDAQLNNAEVPVPADVDMRYDHGWPDFSEPLLNMGPVNGVEDTGGGAADCLLLHLQP